ncbi:MAG: hypothetical protein KIT84_22030 [Labilithrix sp.]|nr:hypothetical protein [Labilithrix sp.]MCW5813724.1 hypothetical protein [Labilithrix sp.]
MSDRVVARGRIKVDARKALDKLRDHMLVDPYLWVCEIARVAVALGATRLDVDWDSDELFLDFDGRGLAPDAIAHARDHVLTREEGADGDALRLLGIGVGAALSLDPAFVDVLRIDGVTATRVRFERGYIDQEHAVPEREAIAAPADLDASTTMRVHARRRRGLKSLGRALSREVPPEIARLEEAIDTRSLHLRGKVARRTVAPILSVNLDIPGTTRAELEVLPGARLPTLDFCERGVRLASYVLPGCWNLARKDRPLPVRAVIDAPRLPTNASRSQVHHDAELVRRAHALVDPAFAIAVGVLRDPSAKAPRGRGVTIHAEAAVLARALGAIAAEVAIAKRAGTAVPPEADALLDLPVLYDAFGGALAIRETAVPVRVHEGAAPLAKELAPWLGGTVWLRGLPSERVLEGLATVPVQDLVPAATAASQRRARALMHPASKPVVVIGSDTLAKESFEVTEGPFAGLHGEIALAAAAHGRPSTARLFVDERALETVTLTGVRLPIDLALAWHGRIVPRFAYDAVERNDDLTRALLFARRLAASFVVSQTKDPAPIRSAIAMWAEATEALGDGADLGVRANAAVWRTNDGRLVSLRTIRLSARRGNAICYAASKTKAPHGRLVLATADLAALRLLLPKDTFFVPYDRALEASHELPEAPPAVSLAIDRDAFQGFVAPGRGRLRVYHAGRRVRDEAWASRNGPVDVVLVDRDAIPQPDLDGCVWATPLVGLAADEDALLHVVADACERDAIPLASVADYVDVSARRVAERGDDPALATKLRALPERARHAQIAERRAALLARAPIDLSAELGDAVRGSVVVPKIGAVAVTLARGLPPPVEVLFAGHPLGTSPAGALPVAAWVDVVDEGLIEDWSQLSRAGASWAQGAIKSAALSLALALAKREDFADDGAALALLAALYATDSAGADTVFETVRWPTVQGPAIQLPPASAARWGAHRYERWRTEEERSPFDAPALYLPATTTGELRLRILASALVTLTDVTDAVARLQALRAAGKRGAPPKLDGAPAHPLLRRSFTDLGALSLEGEVELVDSASDDVAFVDADGVRRPIALSFGCPIRAVYRVDVNAFAPVSRELVVATERLVRSLARSLADVPLFVRDRLRALLATELLRSGRVADEDATCAVFSATDGQWYSFAELESWPVVRFTTDPPPFPHVELCLRLSATEALALARVFRTEDATAELRAIARGDERRAAPPRTEIVLDAATRAQCLFTIDVDEERFRGEIGLLRPRHAAARRIDLFTTMRPLVTIADPGGWPLVAALNHDALVPTPAFDGLVDPKEPVARVHRLVRRLAGASVATFLEAPKDTLGVIRLPASLPVRSVGGSALGVFWLPRAWPERPTIDVEAVGVVDKDRLSVMERQAHSTVVPVCGRVYVTADATTLARAVEDVMAWVAVRLAAHVRAAPANAETDAYRWDLALLGVLDEPAIDPVAELATDRPAPSLMRVVARRAPHLVDRATGDAPPTVEVVEPSATSSFFDGIVRRVVELVTRTSELPATSPLTEAIGLALTAMSLTGDPVAGVREAKRGRPIVFHRASRWVVVNTRHPVVTALAARPDGVLHLVVAALSEINRELTEVTDAEEVAQLLDLLRANATASG